MQPAIHGLLAVAVLAAASLTLVDATYYCRAPPSVENGRHSGTNRYYFQEGSVITYWCDDGYSLQGASRRMCSYSRSTRKYQWDGAAPACISDHRHTDNDHDDDDDDDSEESSTSGRGTTYCSRPERPDNGWVKYRYTSVGAQAWYYCKQGYTRVGAESRTCKPNGKWEPELPTCERSGCEKLVSPHYGIVIYSSTTVGSYAKYFCKDGYYLVGIRFRKCEETGWTDEAPICKPILCDRLPSLKYGRIRLSYGYKWNSVATHSCNWGYQFKKDHGNVKRVCQEDGSWSGSPPLCIPIDCGPLSAPDNGSVRVTSTRVGAIAKYACNEGFTLGGRKTRTCQKSGMWSGDAPTCKRHNHSYIKHW